MAETRTAIKITYDSGNSGQNLNAELDALIEKARTLQSTLGSISIGGRGGSVPNADEHSSLNSSLPMARTAPGGNTSSVVTGGSSTQGGGNQSDAAQGVFDPTMRTRTRLVNPGFYDLPAGKGMSSAVDLTGFGGTLLDSPNGPYRVPRTITGISIPQAELDALAAAKKKPGLSDKISGLTNGRGGYAMMIAAGLVAHGVTSRYADYWSSMYSAAPVETAGLYSGNYFQMLQSQQEAQAIRQSASMRASWAPAQIGSTGLMGLAPMLMLGIANPLIGIAAAGAAMGGGVALNMWSSKGQAGEQSMIDRAMAQRLAGLRTAQQLQSSTTQAVGVMAGAIPFGLQNQSQLDVLTRAGRSAGYSAVESHSMLNQFYQAGGNINSPLAKRVPEMARFRNVSAGTLGSVAKTFLPGGGSRADVNLLDINFFGRRLVSASVGNEESLVTRSLGFANTAGIDASRRNEWLQRQAAFNARYAERGLTVSANAQTEIMRRYGNPKLKGMSQVAFTENIQQFGMGVADELSESMMPKRLAQALMLQRAIANGKNPAEWYRNLSNPVMAAAMGADIESKLPDMLRPFFAAQVTGMVPDAATFRGGGVKPTSSGDKLPSSNYSGETGSADVDRMIEILAKSADAANASIQSWNTTIENAVKQLDAFRIAVANANAVMGNIPVAH